MRVSKRSGELALMMPNSVGVASIQINFNIVKEALINAAMRSFAA